MSNHSTDKGTRRGNTRKIVISRGAVGAAAPVAGMGTFTSSTSSTSSTSGTQQVPSGTVHIALGTANPLNNRLSVAATNIVPGDTIQRTATLTNTGTAALSGVTLTTTAPTTTSALDTDATRGLQMTIQSCASAWTESGTSPYTTATR